jgi:hypothetical protein
VWEAEVEKCIERLWGRKRYSAVARNFGGAMTPRECSGCRLVDPAVTLTPTPYSTPRLLIITPYIPA